MNAPIIPRWNIDDLIDVNLGTARTEAGYWQPDLSVLKHKVTAFATRYRGTLADAEAALLAQSIEDYQAIYEDMGRIGSYAGLLHAENMQDATRGAHYQALVESLTDLEQTLVFYPLELNTLSESHLKQSYAESEVLASYASWLEDLRRQKPYELPEREEKLLSQKSLTGRTAWIRLFDETQAAMRFDYRGQSLTQSEILKLLSEPDRSVRQQAAQALTSELAQHSHVLTMVTNVLAKDKQLNDDWRGFSRPISSRNLDNLIEDEVVDALVSAVKAAYPRLSHRYYPIKARLLSLDKLQHWDRNAPLPQAEEKTVTWPEAQQLILSAYHDFSPEMGEIAQKFFTQGWIDAAPQPGKAGGAFAHPTVPSAHPFILMSYHGKGRDVMTLAHELGHGVHQYLANSQGYLKAQTPLTVAETASVFGEMLSFERLFANTTEKNAKIVLLARKIEDMLNTVVRQISFLEYEMAVHDARKNGELSSEQLGDIWLKVAQDSLGEAFEFDEGFRSLWGYVPHFIHTPFYVYAYAFGDCLVNALYGIYQKGEADFVDHYMALLRAGGSKRYDALLAPFGLNPKDPLFWDAGLGMISGMIDDLEELL